MVWGGGGRGSRRWYLYCPSPKQGGGQGDQQQGATGGKRVAIKNPQWDSNYADCCTQMLPVKNPNKSLLNWIEFFLLIFIFDIFIYFWRHFSQIVQTKNAWQLYVFLTRIAVDKNMLWSQVKRTWWRNVFVSPFFHEYFSVMDPDPVGSASFWRIRMDGTISISAKCKAKPYFTQKIPNSNTVYGTV